MKDTKWSSTFLFPTSRKHRNDSGNTAVAAAPFTTAIKAERYKSHPLPPKKTRVGKTLKGTIPTGKATLAFGINASVDTTHSHKIDSAVPIRSPNVRSTRERPLYCDFLRPTSVPVRIYIT